jgi:hypothetical protein
MSDVGRSPWTAAGAHVGPCFELEEPDRRSGADEGVRPTVICAGELMTQDARP